MPRYYFNVINGHSVPDWLGIELPDISAAREQAVNYGTDLLRLQGAFSLKPPDAGRVIVTDESGSEVYIASFPSKKAI